MHIAHLSHLQFRFCAVEITFDAVQLRFGAPVRFSALSQLYSPRVTQLRDHSNLFDFGGDVSLQLTHAFSLPFNLQLQASVAVGRHEHA
jgi:hypothetical protein